MTLDPSLRGVDFDDTHYNCSMFHELVHVDHCLMEESAVAKFPSGNIFEPAQSTIYEEARTE